MNEEQALQYALANGHDPVQFLAIWRAIVEGGQNAVGRVDPALQNAEQSPLPMSPVSGSEALPASAPLPSRRPYMDTPQRGPVPSYRPAIELPMTAPVPPAREAAPLPQEMPIPEGRPEREPVLPDVAPAPMARPADVPTPTPRPMYFPMLPEAGPVPEGRPEPMQAAPSAPNAAAARAWAMAKKGDRVAPQEPAPERFDGDTSWLAYANQGATRNQPLDPKLVKALSFAPELGIQFEVFSGGQPGKGTGLARVGSVRHDHGNAADVFIRKGGRRLNWANPDDLPIFEEIVRRGRKAGLTGIGAGPGYMQPGAMHLGFGAESVWGAGGKARNAPQWLRNAFYSASPAQVAAASGGGYTPRLPAFAPVPAPNPLQQILSIFR